MFEGLLQPTHLLVILIIVILVFGPKRFPEIGKGLGDAMRGLKRGISSENNSNPTATAKNKDDTNTTKV